MRARLAASAILVALLTAGTTGCTFITSQATTMKYDPSDGIGTTLGDVTVNNALLVTEDGKNANLVVSLHNSSDSTVLVTVQYENAQKTKVDDTIFVSPDSVTSLGGADAEPITLTNIKTTAGSLFPVFIQYGDVTGKLLNLPVLAPNDPYEGLAP